MTQDVRRSFCSSQKGLLFGGALSLLVGLFLASVYANFRQGITLHAIQSFDIFAIWYEAPFFRGYVTQVFTADWQSSASRL
ncbi:hypothetical protein CWO90_45520 [Bradyrhizobium sp. Leo121]|nr:hypothetical protein CWO90_45520 [Bradyrhizobium sp. Leo121]